MARGGVPIYQSVSRCFHNVTAMSALTNHNPGALIMAASRKIWRRVHSAPGTKACGHAVWDRGHKGGSGGPS